MFVPLQLNSMRNRVEEQSRASYMEPCKTLSNCMLDAMMATTVHANVNGSAAKHVCSSTAEFYEKPCGGTKQSFIHGALQNNVQHHLAGPASPSNLGSCTKCISICPCRLAPVQDASAHAHSLGNAVGIRTSCQQHVFFCDGSLNNDVCLTR